METLPESVTELVEPATTTGLPVLQRLQAREHVCHTDTCMASETPQAYHPTNCVQLGLRIQDQLIPDSQSGAHFVGQSDPDVRGSTCMSVVGNPEEQYGLVQREVCDIENSQNDAQEPDQDISRSDTSHSMVIADASKPACSATSQCQNVEIPPNSVLQSRCLTDSPQDVNYDSHPKGAVVLPNPENCGRTDRETSSVEEEDIKMYEMKEPGSEPTGGESALFSDDHLQGKQKVGSVGADTVFCSMDTTDTKHEDILPILEEEESTRPDPISFA